MDSEPRTDHPAAPDDQVERGVFVSPVFVLSQTFPARPSSIPEAHEFVRSTLAAADAEPVPRAELTDAINSALLAAAGPAVGSFAVRVRLFPSEAEVEVLSTADPGATAAAAHTTPAAGSFAQWLAESLRNEGLSQVAAARHLGVSVRTVSRWVRGQTEPRMRDMRRISEVFGPVPR
jgi:hypothetical protein